MKRDIKKKLKNIEDKFFDIDHKNKVACIRLRFDKPSDILDNNIISKEPVLSDGFNSWVRYCFDYVPKKYKIDIDVEFKDMEGYTNQQLNEIFFDNVYLEAKKAARFTIDKNKLGITLLPLGIGFIIASFLVVFLWPNGDLLRDIISRVIEICGWVLIWQAFTIFIIENKEKRDLRKNLTKRFNAITFKETPKVKTPKKKEGK